MTFDDIQQRSREVFRLEAGDLLRDLEAALLELEPDPRNTAAIDRVFRVMHTLKGSGATSGFQELSTFLHRVEEVFTAARAGRIELDTAGIDLTLKLGDAVQRYLAAAPADAPDVLLAAQGDLEALLQRLPTDPTASTGKTCPAAPQTFLVKFKPRSEIFRSGFDPGVFLDDLRTLGPCSVRGCTDRLPALAAMDPEQCYLHWEMEITTTGGAEVVRSVFMFIDDACDLDVTAIDRPTSPAPAGDMAAWQVEFQVTAATLAAPGALDALWKDLAALGAYRVVQSPPSANGGPATGTWRLILDTVANAETIGGAFIFLLDAQPRISREPFAAAETVSPELARPAAAAPPAVERAAPAAPAADRAVNDTLRVSAERLDRLVNLVGELVIIRSQVSTACAGLREIPPALHSAAEALQVLSTEMRDVVLNIRMMPIEQTFGKFRRLVRDLSRSLGKEVDLVVEGAETEMDKTVLDALADPLMHLVRNSIDHGLETPAVRLAAGKAAHGVLRLSAAQRGDRVWVTVADDGGGLDAAKIRAKAISRGLLTPEARPTEAELFQLIFLPGFSTADTVSQVSGRGVGLDVVRRQLEHLRGTVEVRSQPGKGAEFRMSLPLTLAIIEGLLVQVDGDRYILPLSIARETIELTRRQREAGNHRNAVALRGELVPYIRLRDLFAFASPPPDPERVIILEHEEHRIGLVVDQVIGNHQTVLKSLGWLGHRAPIFSGATVLGDGRVALIVDVPALLAFSQRQHTAAVGLEV